MRESEVIEKLNEMLEDNKNGKVLYGGFTEREETIKAVLELIEKKNKELTKFRYIMFGD